MSSAGLIYKHYGKEIIKNIAKSEYEKDLDQAIVNIIFEKMYKKLILEIDALDNGMRVFC